MGQTRDSFVFYKSFFDALSECDDNTRLKCYDAIAKYALNNETTELEGIAKIIFTLIKPNLDANNKRQDGGKKGGRPKKAAVEETENDGFENEKPMVSENKTYGFENEKPNEDEDKDGDKDKNEEVNKEKDKNKKEKAKKEKVFLSEYKFSDSEIVQNAFNGFLKMRISMKKPMTEQAITMLKTKLNTLSSDEYEQADILDQSTFKTWDSVYPLDKNFVSTRDRPTVKKIPDRYADYQ